MLQNLERESWYVGNLVGVPIFLHWTALLMVFMCWGPGAAIAGQLGIGTLEGFVLMMIALVLGVLLHELGHGLMGKALGAFGTTITLWAFGGLCRSARDDRHVPREIAIVAAGPLVSLALWQGAEWTLGYLGDASPGLLMEGGRATLLAGFLAFTAVVNLSLLMFNILPIFPLDGGQLVYQGMRLVFRDRLIVRQISLTLAVFGAIAYFCWSTGLFGLLGRPDAIGLWAAHLQDNLGSVATRAILLAMLLRNAFAYLA